MIRKLILIALLPLYLYSNECEISYKMMWSIAHNEKHKKRAVGYPYLISFNNKKQRFMLKPQHLRMMLDNRTLDCKNQKLCTQIASYLIKKGVRNMDMGPFQVCYYYHGKKMPLKSFFSLNDSYRFANNWAKVLVKKHGCTWQALARYHSGTKTLNTKYARRLQHAYAQN
jgi:hypothetical protein